MASRQLPDQSEPDATMVPLADVLDQLRNADVYGNVPAGTPWRLAFETAATVLENDLDELAPRNDNDPPKRAAVPGDDESGDALSHEAQA